MAKKIACFHKNQAVNLQQIPIHGQEGDRFLLRRAVNFLESRIATAFSDFFGEGKVIRFTSGFAAKFLQSTFIVFLQKRGSASEAYLFTGLFQAGIKRAG